MEFVPSPAEATASLPSPPGGAVEWRCSDTSIPYEAAVAAMEARIAAIRAGASPEMVWLLEHPPLYTAGTSARPDDQSLRRRIRVTE